MAYPEHHPRYGRKRLGAMPFAHINGAAGVRYGTTARCSCGEWDWYTNEKPPSKGGRKMAEEAFTAHLVGRRRYYGQDVRTGQPIWPVR